MALSLLARRVCEHVYTFETSSLLANVVVAGMKTPGVVSNLQGDGGAAKISKLGAR